MMAADLADEAMVDVEFIASKGGPLGNLGGLAYLVNQQLSSNRRVILRGGR